MFGTSSQLPTTAKRVIIKSNRRTQLRQRSWKHGGAAKHLIDDMEKYNNFCLLSSEFQSPHMIERLGKNLPKSDIVNVA